MGERTENESVEPSGMLETFDELLKRPRELARADRSRSSRASLRLLAGSTVCWMAYGAAAGFFQGGSQIPLAAVKAVLILGASLLICAPSLYVFATLLGGDLSGRRFLALVSGFAGMVALLLLGLVPIGWLFSVSSASLSFVVWLHLCLWLLCLAFAARFLSMVLSETGAHRAAVLWVGLFCVVVFQVTTLLRPVLLREPGTPAFVGAKMFFLEQFDRVTEDPTVPPGGKP